MIPPALSPLLLTGFLLGWSIAWPPGPINAEIVRRGLARGFRAGLAVALGAATGDALWAFSVVMGAGLLLVGTVARLALGIASTALLLILGGLFLRGAWRAAGAWRRRAMTAPASVAIGRAGYFLGLGMSLTSPWNVAFWLAVIGRPEMAQYGVSEALTLAGAVITGTLGWCVLLCTAVALLRWRFDGALWQILATGATGLLMLAFAARSALRLAAV